MKALLIYDSNYGNTKEIALSITKGLGSSSKCVTVSEFKRENLNGVTHLVVGSPILGWRPSENMNRWLDSLGSEDLKEIMVVSFDTRMKIFFHGDAAKKILSRLIDKGGKKLSDPKVFFVKDKEGPLFEGELERAEEWGKEISNSSK